MAFSGRKGPIKTGGPDDGSSPSRFATVPALHRVRLSADGEYSLGKFPKCDLTRLWVNVDGAWAGSGTSIRVGNGSDIDFYGSVSVSAAGQYDVAVSAASLLSVSDGTEITVDVTTVGSAGAGTGWIYAELYQLED